MFLIALKARADTTNIKMAWDFRVNEWKTIEFIQKGNKDYIKIYTTAEDVTKKVTFRYVNGKNIFIIKDKK